MVKYLNAEFYKAARRKYTYVFPAVMLGLAAFVMILLRVEGFGSSNDGEAIIIQRVSVGDMLGILSMMLSMGLYLLMLVADIVFSEQYKYNTLKNEVSFGLPRVRIYFGKLIAAVLTSVVICAVLVAGYLLLAFLMFPAGEAFGESLRTFGSCLLMAIPLWLGGLGFFTMLQFLLKGSTSASIVYVMVIAIFGSGFLELMEVFIPTLKPVAELVWTISLNTPFSMLHRYGPEAQMGYAWVLGMSWLVASTVVGLIGFHKKEIN